MIPFHNPKGQEVGHLDDEVYYALRNKNHFFRKFQGYGISDDIIKKLIPTSCNTIVIIYNGKNGVKKLKTKLSNWIESTKKYTDTSMGFDDLQVFISECDMEVLV